MAKKTTGFEKFIRPELTGAKKKEALKQQKRAAKAEARARGEEARKRNKDKFGWVTKESMAGKEKPKGSIEKAKNHPFYSQKGGKAPIATFENKEKVEDMPLNKFLAHAGVCSRREAANLIKDGLVTVNKVAVTEPGHKVSASDTVTFKGKKLFIQKNLVYLLLNKPKDHLTTTTDPQGRRTIFDIVGNATEERIFPVGRLDRNTTGVLLLTNDGELAQQLTHPSFSVKKIYEAKLDKPLTKKDAEQIINGIELEDGSIHADSVGFVDPKDKTVVGIEIHSGRNRIVRRIFEYLGYDVKALDRVMFGNLTKKNVERGHWRFLKEKEVRLLKYMNQSFVKKDKKDKEEPED